MAETFWNWFNPLKWYWKTLTLIFFWPIIIPIYAWTKTDWPNPVKWVVTIVAAFVFIGLAAAQTSPPPANDLPEPIPSTSTAPQAMPKKTAPKITYKTIEVTESVPFVEERTQDPNLEKGQSQVRQEGATGVKTFVYKVQLKDDVEVTRTLENEVVSIQPTPKIIADGTKEPPPPAPVYAPPPPPPPANDETVYITKTGERYHRAHPDGCHSYLSRSKFAISKSQAIAQGYTPCQCGQCGW
ncbi:MAG: G5 domain-containing protein [Actinomycetota bacterium]|nr:G5 domain-containing protein [Actinomycetota bacterium]